MLQTLLQHKLTSINIEVVRGLIDLNKHNDQGNHYPPVSLIYWSKKLYLLKISLPLYWSHL